MKHTWDMRTDDLAFWVAATHYEDEQGFGFSEAVQSATEVLDRRWEEWCDE